MKMKKKWLFAAMENKELFFFPKKCISKIKYGTMEMKKSGYLFFLHVIFS